MVIKASLSRQIDSLIADLVSPRRHAVETAIARLTVIGGRAVARLVGLLDSTEASPASRVAALRALEAIADPRAFDAALRAVDDPAADVAEAAIAVARLFLRGPRGVAVVDQLTRVALDRTRSEPIRVAAIRALGDLKPSTVQPLIQALANEPGDGLSSAARRTASVSGFARDRERRLRPAAEGALPDDPVAFRRVIAQEGHAAPLPVLHRLVERLRDREAADPHDRRAEWMAARAAVHVALARRDSRLGLYDLRETLETAAGPLPVEFLSALSAVGDASCLEPIAAAFARPAGSGLRDEWWHRHLASAFQAIVGRERITRRHRAVRKIERRWKGTLRELWPERP